MTDAAQPDERPNEPAGQDAAPAEAAPIREGGAQPAPQPPGAPPPMPPEIARAIVAVCRQVESLKMDGQNKEQGYRFASIDAFLAAVGSWCAQAGLAIIPEEVRADLHVIGTWRDRFDRPRRDEVLEAEYRFWLMHESGAIWPYPMTRRVRLAAFGPQAYGSAESYVLKRFLRALFKVPTGDALDPASDVWDPDGGRDRRPEDRGGNARGDDLGLERPKADPPPGVASAREKSSRRTIRPPQQQQQQQPAEPPAGTPPADPRPTDGRPPFLIFDGLGDVIAEYTDLKSWGRNLKAHLEKFPSTWARNEAEINRIEQAFLSDPDVDEKARASMKLAFESLRKLAPKPPRPEPPHDPETGEVLSGEERREQILKDAEHAAMAEQHAEH